MYLKAGNTSAARADFEGAIDSAAGKSGNSKALSKAYFFQQMMLPEQDRARKVELLNKAIRLDPQNFQYRLVRGARLDEMGQVLLALVDTQKAISLFAEENDLAKWAEIVPEIRDAFHNLAHILYQLKKPEEALKSYTVAVDLSWKTRPHTKEEAKFVVHIGREMFSFLNAPDDAKKAFNVAEKMSPAVTAERSSFNEKLLYFVNKSQTKLVLAIKYHTLGKDNQWRWLPGDLTTADAANQTIGPGESAFLAVKEKGRIKRTGSGCSSGTTRTRSSAINTGNRTWCSSSNLTKAICSSGSHSVGRDGGEIGVSRLCRLAAPGMMKMELGLGSLWLEASVG